MFGVFEASLYNGKMTRKSRIPTYGVCVLHLLSVLADITEDAPGLGRLEREQFNNVNSQQAIVYGHERLFEPTYFGQDVTPMEHAGLDTLFCNVNFWR